MQKSMLNPCIGGSKNIGERRVVFALRQSYSKLRGRLWVLLLFILAHHLRAAAQNPFDIGTMDTPVDVQSSETAQTQFSDSVVLDSEQLLRHFVDPNIVEVDPAHPDSKEALSNNPFEIRHSVEKSMESNPRVQRKTEKKTAPPILKKNRKTTKATANKKPWISKYGWSLLYVVILLGLLAFLVQYDRSLLNRIWQSQWNTNTLKILFREEYITNKWLFWSYYVLFFLTAPILLFYYLKSISDTSENLLLTLSFAVIIVIYLTKHLVNYFFRYITNYAFESRYYQYLVLLSNIIIGICLIPLVMILSIGNQNITTFITFIGITIIALMYLYRQVRALIFSRNLVARYTFHFFLYICAIEILPLLLVGKFMLK